MDNLNIRLRYAGGRADNRMEKDKLRTFKKSLLYSYQSETAVLSDGREFRCLINPDKLKNDYDNKILSIPFYDICLNSEFLGIPSSLAEEPTNIKVGDVFKWKETDTYWIVYLRYLEESAYFRAEIRKCSGVINIDGIDYWAYMRGPVETKIRWNQKSDISWNDLNYSRVAYVTEDEHTKKLKRFDVVKVDGKNYEVQVINKDTASDGIMIIYLKETYTNSIEEENKKLVEQPEEEIKYAIQGDEIVYPYDIKTYSIGEIGGHWRLSNSNARILKATDSEVTIEIVAGRPCEVTLVYTTSGGIEVELPLQVKSF